MTLASEQLQAMAAQWQVARRLSPVYKGIAHQFKLAAPSCAELEAPADRADAGVLTAVRGWLRQMDDLIGVHQLRRFVQTSPLSTEATLNALAQHFLTKDPLSKADRDKLDFVLVQYFAQCVPGELVRREITLADVAGVLRPVLGEVVPQLPAWLQPLEQALGRIRIAASMRELLRAGALEEGRNLKASSDARRSEPAALVAFTRFNFIVRQIFVRLIDNDFEAISHAVRELKQRGVSEVDCHRAQLSATEKLERVLETAHQLKQPFLKEYSSGNPLAQLTELRNAVEEALAKTSAQTAPPPAPVVSAPTGAAAAAKPAPVAVSQAPPRAEPSGAPGVIPEALTEELSAMVAQLAKFLAADAARTRSVGATIVLGKVRLPLSSWEVKAFVEGMGEFSEIVQQGVAMRILLTQALASAHSGKPPAKLRTLAEAARVLGIRLQQGLAAARKARNIEAGANMSATGQRLAAALAEAGQLLEGK